MLIKTEDAAPLTERLMTAMVAGCTCGTKTPVMECHDPQCHYRLFIEAVVEIKILRDV